MPASDEEVREAGEDGVTIKCGWGPKEVLVSDGKVTGIVFKKCLSVFEEVDGRKKFAPKYDENETITIECDRVIFAVGQQSVWGDVKERRSRVPWTGTRGRRTDLSGTGCTGSLYRW